MKAIYLGESVNTRLVIVQDALSPESILEKMAERNAAFAVIVDRDNNPVSLCVAEDLRTASEQIPLQGSATPLPPLILASTSTTLQELVDNQGVINMAKHARGVVAYNDENLIVGVLPTDAVQEFIATGYLPTANTMSASSGGDFAIGDPGLPGSHNVPPIIAKCSAQVSGVSCGYYNTLSDWTPPQECKNPDLPKHNIRLG